MSNKINKQHAQACAQCGQIVAPRDIHHLKLNDGFSVEVCLPCRVTFYDNVDFATALKIVVYSALHDIQLGLAGTA